MHPFVEQFHHCGSVLASPESLTIIAMRSTPPGVRPPRQAPAAAFPMRTPATISEEKSEAAR